MSTLRRAVRPVPSGTAAVMTAALLASATPALAQTPAALTVDFDAAMNSLRFNQATLDANRDSTDAGNGMLDADEMALVSVILANPSLNLKAKGGVDQAAVKAAFEQARESARTDLKALLGTYPTAVEVVAALDPAIKPVAPAQTATGWSKARWVDDGKFVTSLRPRTLSTPTAVVDSPSPSPSSLDNKGTPTPHTAAAHA